MRVGTSTPATAGKALLAPVYLCVLERLALGVHALYNACQRLASPLTTEWVLRTSFPSKELVLSIVLAFTLLVVAVAPEAGRPPSLPRL
jgi:hypothetical protein